MCGLIYGRSKSALRPINKTIIKQFANQRSRGTDGFGIYDAEHQKLVKETTEAKIMKWLRKHNSTEIMFHHRIPTSTANVRNASHPFSSGDFFGDKQFLLIHNGVLRNADELARKHERYGIVYSSSQKDGRFNDSEALMWEVALYLSGTQNSMDAIGTAAFICIEKEKDKNVRLYWYRNTGNPLYKKDTKKHFILCSTLEDAFHESIKPDVLFCYDYETQETTETALQLKTYVPVTTSPSWNHAPAPDTADWYKNYQARQDPDFYGDGATAHLDDEYGAGYDDDRELDTADTIRSMMEEDEQKQLALITDHSSFSADIKDKSIEYLNYADGYYELAVNMMEERIDELSLHAYNINEWYEKEVLRAASGVLLADPFWVDQEAEIRHPLFQAVDDVAAEAGSDTAVQADGNTESETDQTESRQLSLTSDGSDREVVTNSAVVIREIIKKRSDNFKKSLDDAFDHHVHKVPVVPALVTEIPKGQTSLGV